MQKETKVIVSAETSKYQRAMKKLGAADAKATRDMRYRWAKVKTAMQGVSVAALAFAGTFAYAMKKSIDAASNLEETSSKFAVVFAGQMDLAERNAKILGDSYAMSREEAKRYLSSVQDLLVPMGVAADYAAGLSHEVVKLSADLGSFNNLPTEKVMLDIQSALVGNFETMKKYGVVLKETVVSEKALAMGLATTKDELTAGHKAQAAYALMVEGSKAAIGDMERTSESYANQVKQLDSNIKDLTAEIGKELLPFATEMIKRMNEWLEVNDELIKSDIVSYVQNIAAAIEIAIKPLRVWAEFWKTIGWISSGQTGMMPGLQTPPPDKHWSQIEAGGSAGGIGGDITPEDTERLATLEADKTAMIFAELEQRWTNEAEYAAKVKAIEDERLAQTERIENQIVSLKQWSAQSQMSIARGLFTTALNLAGVQGKKMFIVQKVADVAIAVMSAFKGSAIARANPPGPPWTEPVAQLALKAGLMNAAAIAAVSLGQITAPSGATGGGTYVSPTVTTPEEILPTTEETRGSLTINIQGDFIGDEGFIDTLVEKINAAEDRDVFINQTNYATELV